MTHKALLPVGITALRGCAPPRRLTNAELEQIVDTSDEWIRTRSGICTRHIADPEMALSDLLLPAAQAALADVHLAAADVDLIVVASVTGDMPLPSTACLLQHRLEATHAAAFDIAAACTGFIYGLSVASSMVATGQYRNALVLGGDLLSRITDYTDRGTCVLLGDGGGAAVLQPVPDGRGILSSYLRADGSGGDLLTIPAGGSRRPTSMETVTQREHYLRMNGSEVYKFAVRALEEAVCTVLERIGACVDDVALVIPHQANLRIIEASAKRLGIPLDRWIINLQEYGNTSAGSIPLAFGEALEQERIHAGDLIVLVGFGGGLTWGAVALRW
ncbi:MAG: beta-ketoacyl-ACP synthase III [Armatimonadota bacterium]